MDPEIVLTGVNLRLPQGVDLQESLILDFPTYQDQPGIWGRGSRHPQIW
jgi:hypothetical protein